MSTPETTTPTTHPLTILFDRSRTTEFWRCPRARYHHYERGGRGIVSTATSLELWLGTALHDALAAIARGHVEGDVNIEAIATAAGRAIFTSLTEATKGEIDADAHTFACEQSTLVEGLLRAFYRHQWPRIIAGKRILFIEEEMTATLAAALTFMAKPDLILEDLSDGEWDYVEYKSTSSKKSAWMASWSTAVQLHSTVKAVHATKGRLPARVIVQGLYKGYESYGRQNSPLCYAYVREGQAPFRNEQVGYEYKPGWNRRPVWERPGGIRAWVAGMPDNMLADQFPQAPPIFVNETLVDAFFRQAVMRETSIASASRLLAAPDAAGGDQALLDRVFPQHFDQCTPAWGRGCAFKRLCHGNVEDPLTAGYEWRNPHHITELDAQGGDQP